MALAASSTTEIKRVHRTSSVIASKRWLTASPSRVASWVERHDHVAGRGHREAGARAHDERGTLFLDDRGAGESIADGQPRAVVHGRLDEVAGLGKPDRAAALDGRFGSARASLEDHLAPGDRRTDGDADVDELDRDVGRRERELLAVGCLEGLSERAADSVLIAAVVRPIGQVDHEVEALAQEAAVGEPLKACGL